MNAALAGAGAAEAINLSQRLFVASDGYTFPIVTLFDADGDETDDPCEAVACVAGVEGRWHAINLEDFSAGAFQ
jgi:hypothetical protein